MPVITNAQSITSWWVKSKRAQSNTDDETWKRGGVVPTLNAFDTGDTRATVVVLPTVRRLTPVECERLQGFPDNWTDGQSDAHRYRQMGNAVTVNVASYLAALIGDARE